MTSRMLSPVLRSFLACSTLLLSMTAQAQEPETTPQPAPSTTIDSAELAQGVKLREGHLFERNFATSVTIYLASNYVFRGMTQTRQGPAIQGSFDVTHGSGFGVGGFVSNVSYDAPLDNARTEADLYALYNMALGEWSFGAMAIWYNYVEAPELNAMEYSAFAKYRWLKLDVAHLPKYFGVDSDANYGRVTGSAPMTAKNTLNASIGHHWFGDETKAGNRNYSDYKVSVSHAASEFTTEFMWTDTDRKDFNDQRQKDQALTVIVSRTF